jgi:ribosomal protein S1
MVSNLACLLVKNSNKLKFGAGSVIVKAKVVELKKRGVLVNFGGKN